MSFSIVSTLDAQSWETFASTAPDATLYHLPGWKNVIEDTFAHPTFYLSAVSDSQRLVGMLPLVQLKSRMFGNLLVSLPYFNYGGICAESGAVRDALLAEAVGIARQGGAQAIELRHQEDWRSSGLPAKTQKVSMRLDLPADVQTLWKELGSKLRNQIQKPRKEGLVSTVGREEQIAAFYEVFSANMRDLGTPVYPRVFFSNILRRFPERTWIVTVYREDMPLAAGFVAGFKDRLEIPWASSLRAFNGLNANMLLYWSCLEFAIEHGYRVFDFGRSTLGEGTYRFKEQWGAKAHPLFWQYWIPNGGEIPQVNPQNPRYRAAIAVWQRLPLAVTRCIGPHIVKYIP